MAGTKIPGRNAYIEIASTDYSGEGNNAALSIDVALASVAGFADSWDEFVEGIATWTFEFSGYYADGAASLAVAAQSWIQAGNQALKYAPRGDTVGYYQYTGNIKVKSVKPGTTTTGAATLAVSSQGDGQVSLAAIVP